MRSIVIAILFLFSVFAHAQTEERQKRLVLMGGGGDPPSRGSTSFDPVIPTLWDFTQNAGWSSSYYFDGKFSSTKNTLEKTVGSDAYRSFTDANFKAEIENLKKQLSDPNAEGAFKAGDQLLIMLPTHGVPGKEGELTHSIGTDDGSVSLDELQAVRDLAEAKGVKLAIMDFSCFSGASLKLASDKTCVVSTAGPNSLTPSKLARDFANNLNKGFSLEDVFLMSRKASDSVDSLYGQPQISSPAGKKVFENLKDIETANESAIEMKIHGRERFCNMASATAGYQKLMEDLEIIGKADEALGIMSPVKKDRAEFKAALEEYEKMRWEAAEYLSAADDLSQEVCFTRPSQEKTCVSYGSLKATLNTLEHKLSQASEAEKPAIEKELNVYRSATSRESYKKWLEPYQKFADIEDKLNAAATRVGRAERQVYDHLYRQEARASSEPNPCAEFIF